MPPWVVPDTLTLLGVAGAFVTAAGFILSRGSLQWLWLASLGLVLNWIGDSLDGNLARYRRIERPRYGFFVDSTSDVFSHSTIVLSLGMSPCAHFSVACLGLIGFLIGFAYMLIGAHARAVMRITYFGFGATEIRALLLGGNLLTLAFGDKFLLLPMLVVARFGPITTYDVVILALFMVVITKIAWLAIRESRVLAAEDPPRSPSPAPPIG